MNYCSHCNQPITLKVPDDDNLPRYVCEACDTIHYQNPKIVTGCIPEWEDKILLCKRAIQPRHGLWTLPAGFMENNESLPDAAKRETFEEAQANVLNLELYAVYSIPHISQVYMMFRAQLDKPEFGPGPESLEVELFDQDNIPWEHLAFPVIELTLQSYYQDKPSGKFALHLSNIVPTTVKK